MKISTGSAEFDKWLNGGYEQDIITTFYGPPGSGKSNFCMMAAVNQAITGKKVIFIDSEGSFSIDRLKQLAKFETIKNIILLKVTNFTEQCEAFSRLSNFLKQNISLVVVDSMVMLYRLALGEALEGQDREKARTINRSLVRQLKILNEIARKKRIPVIITDQVYSEFLSREDFEAGKEKKVKMVAGDILKYWSKCIIELQNLSSGRKKAILRKHRSLPEKELIFEIINRGIKVIA